MEILQIILFSIWILLILSVSGYYSMLLANNKKENRHHVPMKRYTQEHIITNRWYDITILEKSFKEYVYILTQRNDYFKYYKNARYAVALVYKEKTHHIIIETTMIPAKDFVKEFNNTIVEGLRKSLSDLENSEPISDNDIVLKLTSTILDFNYSD